MGCHIRSSKQALRVEVVMIGYVLCTVYVLYVLYYKCYTAVPFVGSGL